MSRAKWATKELWQTRIVNLWEHITTPIVPVKDMMRAKLVLGFLYSISTLSFSLVFILSLLDPSPSLALTRLLSIVFLVTMTCATYFLGRRGLHEAIGKVSFFIGVVVLQILIVNDNRYNLIYYNLFTLIVVALFLPLRDLVFVWVVQLSSIFLIFILPIEADYSQIIQGPLPFLLILGVTLILFVVYRDKEEQNRLDQAEQHEKTLRQVSEIARVGFWEVDLDTMQPTWSAVTRQIHEVDDDYVHTMERAISFYAPDVQPLIDELVSKGIAEGKEYDIEVPFVTAKQRRIWVRVISRVERENGKTTRLYGTFQDITQRRQAEDALRQREQLQTELKKEYELNALKTRMMTRISHEFRTPLAVILSSVELLDRYYDRYTAEQRTQKVDKIRHEVQHLTEMLDDIGRVVQGQATDFQPTQIAVADLVQQVIQRIQAIHKDRQLTVTLDSDLPLFYGDRRLLHALLQNLLSNAFKYSPFDTAVALSVVCRGKQLVITVADKGIGMTPDEEKRIFEPFYRGANIGEISGIGLGLSIVKHAVEAHDGTIDINSAPARGTTMMVHLPYPPVASS